MPTVRLTAKLKRDITSACKKVLEQQRQSLPEYDPSIMKKAVMAFQEQYDLGIHGEASMNSNVESVRFVKLMLDDTEMENETLPCAPVKMILPYPCAFGSTTLTINMSERTSFELPTEVTQELKITTKKRKNILEQISAFEKTLEHLLKRCTTVKQFIEAWPQGEQFVPQSALQQHYEQENKRRKRGVYLEDEQLSALNDAILTSKLV